MDITCPTCSQPCNWSCQSGHGYASCNICLIGGDIVRIRGSLSIPDRLVWAKGSPRALYQGRRAS